MDLGWQVRDAGGRLVGEPTGRVDETTWEAFSAHLIAAVRQAIAAGAPLIIDLSGLDYMSSRGLRALTIARREAGEATPITLAAPNDRMREIFAISRYDKLFKIVDDVDSDA
ncbi:MAG: anti-sigma factor antagonist [Phenylobacterium sp.]|uniref:STAS domain-containing protein n=1 Tax=Phenylobacterium sp. TaxID=1871053 RepID=UPI0011F8B0BB|nr:STAS domain-containing protein [Phenylobacterium sp.]TAJ68488.1 MAG: anti-sigma factor antagonist [Phenylobacterium sp.]